MTVPGAGAARPVARPAALPSWRCARRRSSASLLAPSSSRPPPAHSGAPERQRFGGGRSKGRRRSRADGVDGRRRGTARHRAAGRGLVLGLRRWGNGFGRTRGSGHGGDEDGVDPDEAESSYRRRGDRLGFRGFRRAGARGSGSRDGGGNRAVRIGGNGCVSGRSTTRRSLGRRRTGLLVTRRRGRASESETRTTRSQRSWARPRNLMRDCPARPSQCRNRW